MYEININFYRAEEFFFPTCMLTTQLLEKKRKNIIQYTQGSNGAYEIHLLAMNITSKITLYSDWIIDHKRTCNVKYTEITGEMERTEWKLNEINITNQKYMHYERHDGLV